MKSRQTFLSLLALLWWLSDLGQVSRSSYADETVLTRDTKTIKVVPAEETPSDEDEQTGPEKRIVVRVELVQVIPLEKNNPFNPVEPIENSGGKITPPQENVPPPVIPPEQGGGDDGGNGGGNENLFEGPNSIDYGADIPGFFHASVEFNAKTGKFFLIPLSSENSVLTVIAEDGLNEAEFFTNDSPDAARHFDGPDGEVPFNTPRTITVTRTATGEQFRIRFTAGPPGTGLSNVSVTRVAAGNALKSSAMRKSAGISKKKSAAVARKSLKVAVSKKKAPSSPARSLVRGPRSVATPLKGKEIPVTKPLKGAPVKKPSSGK